MDRLNRTSVGLKHDLAQLAGRERWTPQSNQRGIETFVTFILHLLCRKRASIEPAWD